MTEDIKNRVDAAIEALEKISLDLCDADGDEETVRAKLSDSDIERIAERVFQKVKQHIDVSKNYMQFPNKKYTPNYPWDFGLNTMCNTLAEQ